MNLISNGKIQQALTNLFTKQRIVFWYDDQLEFRSEFAGLDLPSVEKIELHLTNNIAPLRQISR